MAYKIHRETGCGGAMKLAGQLAASALALAGVFLSEVQAAVPTKDTAAIENSRERDAQKKADEAFVQEELKKAREAEERKKASMRASFPSNMSDRAAYDEAVGKFDAEACRKELTELFRRKEQIGVQRDPIPAEVEQAKAQALRSNPEIKAIADELNALAAAIREKQNLLKKKIEELDSVKTPNDLASRLENEEGEIEWKRQSLYNRLLGLGEKPPFPGMVKGNWGADGAPTKNEKDVKADKNLHIVK